MTEAKDFVSSNSTTEEISRHQFLQKFGSSVFAALVLPAVLGDVSSAEEEKIKQFPKLPKLPEASPQEDLIIRMMRDLQRALAKPIEQRRWIMVIDLRKCVGCHACTIACVAENKLPPGVVYRPVLEEEIGTFPHVSRKFTPRPCMQCENAPCVKVCPVHATWIRPDGIVPIDYDKCIGCRYCITACPYNARVFDSGYHYVQDENESINILGNSAGTYEKEANYEYHHAWKREADVSPIGNVRKCHFCVHRIENGLLPQCVSTCIGRATFFGDGNDPENLVSELIGKPNVIRLKEEKGTKPNVYYLV